METPPTSPQKEATFSRSKRDLAFLDDDDDELFTTPRRAGCHGDTGISGEGFTGMAFAGYSRGPTPLSPRSRPSLPESPKRPSWMDELHDATAPSSRSPEMSSSSSSVTGLGAKNRGGGSAALSPWRRRTLDYMDWRESEEGLDESGEEQMDGRHVSFAMPSHPGRRSPFASSTSRSGPPVAKHEGGGAGDFGCDGTKSNSSGPPPYPHACTSVNRRAAGVTPPPMRSGRGSKQRMADQQILERPHRQFRPQYQVELLQDRFGRSRNDQQREQAPQLKHRDLQKQDSQTQLHHLQLQQIQQRQALLQLQFQQLQRQQEQLIPQYELQDISLQLQSLEHAQQTLYVQMKQASHASLESRHYSSLDGFNGQGPSDSSPSRDVLANSGLNCGGGRVGPVTTPRSRLGASPSASQLVQPPSARQPSLPRPPSPRSQVGPPQYATITPSRQALLASSSVTSASQTRRSAGTAPSSPQAFGAEPGVCEVMEWTPDPGLAARLWQQQLPHQQAGELLESQPAGLNW